MREGDIAGETQRRVRDVPVVGLGGLRKWPWRASFDRMKKGSERMKLNCLNRPNHLPHGKIWLSKEGFCFGLHTGKPYSHGSVWSFEVLSLGYKSNYYCLVVLWSEWLHQLEKFLLTKRCILIGRTTWFFLIGQNDSAFSGWSGDAIL